MKHEILITNGQLNFEKENIKSYILHKVNEDECSYYFHPEYRDSLIVKGETYLDNYYISCILKNAIPKLIREDDINTTIYDIQKLSEGAYGETYKCKINNDLFLMKTLKNKSAKPIEEDVKNDAIQEFYIGTILNKMRLHCPNFVQTISMFKCDMNKRLRQICTINDQNNPPIIIQEFIEGNTLENMLEKKQLTFNEFLIIFCQILVALQKVQDEHYFTHYDLHPGNILIKNGGNYDVNIRDINIKFESSHCPVIIDYGLGSIYDGNYRIGKYDLISYNITPMFNMAYDYYKFLLFSINILLEDFNGNKQMIKKIAELIKFLFKNDDPYNLSENSDLNEFREKVDVAITEYCLNITNSKLSKLTPHTMLINIYNNYKSEIRDHVKFNDNLLLHPMKLHSEVFMNKIVSDYSKTMDIDSFIDNLYHIVITMNLDILENPENYRFYLNKMTYDIENINNYIIENKYITFERKNITSYYSLTNGEMLPYVVDYSIKTFVNNFVKPELIVNNMDFYEKTEKLYSLYYKYHYIRDIISRLFKREVKDIFDSVFKDFYSSSNLKIWKSVCSLYTLNSYKNNKEYIDNIISDEMQI